MKKFVEFLEELGHDNSFLTPNNETNHFPEDHHPKACQDSSNFHSPQSTGKFNSEESVSSTDSSTVMTPYDFELDSLSDTNTHPNISQNTSPCHQSIPRYSLNPDFPTHSNHAQSPKFSSSSLFAGSNQCDVSQQQNNTSQQKTTFENPLGSTMYDSAQSYEFLTPKRRTGPVRKGNWSDEEDILLSRAVAQYKSKNWKKIAECVPGRTSVQCLHRWQKVLNPNLVKGPWTPEEDEKIERLVQRYGTDHWSFIASFLDGRIGKQCRERWYNHLDPSIRRDPWTEDEDRILLEAQSDLGNRWSKISKRLPGRTDNDCKNHFNTLMARKKKGISPGYDSSRRTKQPRLHRSLSDSDIQFHTDLVQDNPSQQRVWETGVPHSSVSTAFTGNRTSTVFGNPPSTYPTTNQQIQNPIVTASTINVSSPIYSSVVGQQQQIGQHTLLVPQVHYLSRSCPPSPVLLQHNHQNITSWSPIASPVSPTLSNTSNFLHINQFQGLNTASSCPSGSPVYSTLAVPNFPQRRHSTGTINSKFQSKMQTLSEHQHEFQKNSPYFTQTNSDTSQMQCNKTPILLVQPPTASSHQAVPLIPPPNQVTESCASNENGSAMCNHGIQQQIHALEHKIRQEMELLSQLQPTAPNILSTNNDQPEDHNQFINSGNNNSNDVGKNTECLCDNMSIISEEIDWDDFASSIL